MFGITTYTIDELLKVTGPITVPEYGTTIASGETTLKTLQLTRVAKPGENRKAFLSAFADQLFTGLLGLPPGRWTDMLGQADTFRSQRLLLAWFKNPTTRPSPSRPASTAPSGRIPATTSTRSTPTSRRLRSSTRSRRAA